MEDELIQTGGPGLVVPALSSQGLQNDESHADGRLGQEHLLDVLLQPAEDSQHQVHVLAVGDDHLDHPAARLVFDQLKIRI